MAQDNEKPHFWIPDKEVQRLEKVPTGRTRPRDVPFREHGNKLSQGLDLVKRRLDAVGEDDSLKDAGLYVFKVELPEGEKVQSKLSVFSQNGMKVNAVKDDRRAIVSTTKQQFAILANRVHAYAQKGVLKTHFDYVEEFQPYEGTEKNSNYINKSLYLMERPPEYIDVQIMFVPQLGRRTYDSVIPKIVEKIQRLQGNVPEGGQYELSDGTPVIRAVIPSGTLVHYENDQAVYRIEETHFFNADANGERHSAIEQARVDETVDPSSLEVVAVLDSGVDGGSFMAPFVVREWKPFGCVGGDADHGTKVASRVIFGTTFGSNGDLVPRARVVDCNIMDGRVPENVLIKRIQDAVAEFSHIAKIFNLSANSPNPIDGDEMSIIGYELDALQVRYDIQFVVSAGNHELWQVETSLGEILDDDDSRVAAPGDSMLSIVVGAVVGQDHRGSVSAQNEIAPYSRRGPGFAGFDKPDITAYGGTIILTGDGPDVPMDPHSVVLGKGGQIVSDAGTSFTAPMVAGDIAELLRIVPAGDLLLAKALLYHHAKLPFDPEMMSDEELNVAHNLYGRGVSNALGSKYSLSHRATFLRSGTLNKTTKERITIFMPEVLAAQPGRNAARVTVTCLSKPPVDRTKGSQYLGAYVRASLKKSHPDGRLLPVSPKTQEGRKKWDVCHHFSRTFSQFNAGDWQIWLELFSRWEDSQSDVPYALIATIEDLSGMLDIYSEIEALNRYRSLNSIRVQVAG